MDVKSSVTNQLLFFLPLKNPEEDKEEEDTILSQAAAKQISAIAAVAAVYHNWMAFSP